MTAPPRAPRANDTLPDGFNPHGPLTQVAQTLLDGLARRHRHSVLGVETLPPGAFLLVVNHSLATYDILMLGHHLYERTGRFPRGLGDKRLFQVPVLSQLVTYFGGVRASHDAADGLLMDGHIVIVAPGGMSEALRPSDERYRVRWDDRKGFVRLAIRMGVPMVLAACPRADDLYDVQGSELTRSLYDRFHIPVPFLRGEGGGLRPRAIRLVHALSEPIHPPAVEERADLEPLVEPLHSLVMARMNELMQSALDFEARDSA